MTEYAWTNIKFNQYVGYTKGNPKTPQKLLEKAPQIPLMTPCYV